jgi:hypothetical protein
MVRRIGKKKPAHEALGDLVAAVREHVKTGKGVDLQGKLDAYDRSIDRELDEDDRKVSGLSE